MADGRYIRCRNCGAIHHVTPFDRSPIFKFTGDEVEEFSTNDWRDFMSRHAGHRLEPLSSTGNHYFPEGPAHDPMSVGYIEVTNGEETLLLRRSRAGIDEPLSYEIVNGRSIEAEPSLDIQEDAIRKEMKLHFSWDPAAPLNDDQISLFISLFHELARSFDPRSLRSTEDSCADDNVSYCALSVDVVDDLMGRCSRHFLPAELTALRRFVGSHCEGCDVMSLVKRRVVIIEQHAQ